MSPLKMIIIIIINLKAPNEKQIYLIQGNEYFLNQPKVPKHKVVKFFALKLLKFSHV